MWNEPKSDASVVDTGAKQMLLQQAHWISPLVLERR